MVEVREEEKRVKQVDQSSSLDWAVRGRTSLNEIGTCSGAPGVVDRTVWESLCLTVADLEPVSRQCHCVSAVGPQLQPRGMWHGNGGGEDLNPMRWWYGRHQNAGKQPTTGGNRGRRAASRMGAQVHGSGSHWRGRMFPRIARDDSQCGDSLLVADCRASKALSRFLEI